MTGIEASRDDHALGIDDALRDGARGPGEEIDLRRARLDALEPEPHEPVRRVGGDGDGGVGGETGHRHLEVAGVRLAHEEKRSLARRTAQQERALGVALVMERVGRVAEIEGDREDAGEPVDRDLQLDRVAGGGAAA